MIKYIYMKREKSVSIGENGEEVITYKKLRRLRFICAVVVGEPNVIVEYGEKGDIIGERSELNVGYYYPPFEEDCMMAFDNKL